MKAKLTVLCLSVVMSFQAHAIVGGSSVNKANFQQFVEMGCTGNIIGGKWVLTAAHCPLSNVTLHDGTTAIATNKINHPSFDGTLNDIGFIQLQNVQATNKINTLSVSNIGAGEAITAYGFGGTAPQLYRAIQTSEAQGVGLNAQYLRTVNIGQGNSVSGDSGMSYLNAAEEIVAVHNAGSSTSMLGMEGFRVELARQFILDTVNGWHYPTNLEFNGNKVITVQSLHVGGATDAAYTTGDLTIDYASSTCDDGAIAEYASCTYAVTTNGGQGQLHLSANEKININKPTSNNNSSGGGDSGGGSLSFNFILALLGMGIIRQRVKK